MAKAYGAKRTVTEKEYEQMDKCDMLIRDELKSRNEHAQSIRQKENIEDNLWWISWPKKFTSLKEKIFKN